MYTLPCADMCTEITDAEKIVEWMTGSGLDEALKETEVCGDYERLSIGGHSRGGAVAFAVAERGNVKVSCVVGLDPVDNGVILKGKGHEEWMLEGVGKILVGMALGEQKGWLFPPACAPKGRNQREFWTECCGPLFQLVAKEYGHMDVLDDDTPGIIGALSSCMCKKGPSRAPARCFAGGCVVAFLAWFLRDDKRPLTFIMSNPSACPVEVETPQSRGV